MISAWPHFTYMRQSGVFTNNNNGTCIQNAANAYQRQTEMFWVRSWMHPARCIVCRPQVIWQVSTQLVHAQRNCGHRNLSSFVTWRAPPGACCDMTRWCVLWRDALVRVVTWRADACCDMTRTTWCVLWRDALVRVVTWRAPPGACCDVTRWCVLWHYANWSPVSMALWNTNSKPHAGTGRRSAWLYAGWPLTWKTWKSQGILKWFWKSQWKWKKSEKVRETEICLLDFERAEELKLQLLASCGLDFGYVHHWHSCSF